MSKTDANTDNSNIAVQDQDQLGDDTLKDQGEEDAAIWVELDEAEADADADTATDDISGAGSADAAATDESELPDDEAGKADRSQEDAWAGASEEQRAAHEADQALIEKLENTDRSNRGRIGALQRRINATQVDAAETPAAEDQAAPATSENWDDFQKEYPEVAGPAGERIEGIEDTVKELREKVNARDAEDRDAEINEQQELLEEQHDDWKEVTAAEGFGAWLIEQPRHMQEAAARNGKEIVDALEAADVVGRWKAAQSESTDEPGGNEEPGKGTTRLEAKRQRQLRTASSTRAGGPGAAHGIPEEGDEEALWKAWDKKDARDAKRA